MSKSFGHYDSRGYTTLNVTDGYAAWATTYDALSLEQDLLDRPLLETSSAIAWAELRSVVDLACGTGRNGAYLKNHRHVDAIDGVDLSPEMLKLAATKNVYRQLLAGDICAMRLRGPYDAAFCSLAACHLEDLRPLYREAARLIRSGGVFVVIDFHQFFLLQGIPTHFEDANGKTLAIQNTVHFASDHIQAGLSTGWQLAELRERLIDEAWIAQAPRLSQYIHRPVSFMLVWKRN